MRKPFLTIVFVAAAVGLAETVQAQASHAEVTAAVRAFAETGDARVIRKPGSVSFPYGGSQRVVLTCAPLRTCKVLLNDDEQYLGHVAGDTDRWFIQETLGPGGVSLMVIKPFECNVTTDLTITTTKRIYDMVADSPDCAGEDVAQNPDMPWTPLVEFYYPHDVITRAADAEARLRQSAAAGQALNSAQSVGMLAQSGGTGTGRVSVPVAARNADPSMLHFAYRWQRDERYPWVPAQVYDDGYHTYIKLKPEARKHEQPILFEVAPDGSMEMVNYLVTPMDAGDVYKVDRVMQRGVLVVGDAQRRGAQRLLIIRNGS